MANKDSRSAIRNTWGSSANRKDLDIGFVLGRTSDAELQSALDKEAEEYGDIIQGFSVDSYKNLTLKTYLAHKWVAEKCPQVRKEPVS